MDPLLCQSSPINVFRWIDGSWKWCLRQPSIVAEHLCTIRWLTVNRKNVLLRKHSNVCLCLVFDLAHTATGCTICDTKLHTFRPKSYRGRWKITQENVCFLQTTSTSSQLICVIIYAMRPCWIFPRSVKFGRVDIMLVSSM